jgi:hypothetical protein
MPRGQGDGSLMRYSRISRPEGCEMSRIELCLDNRLTDGGKVISPTHRPHFTPQKHYYFSASGTHFCKKLSKSQGLVRPKGLGKLKKITSSGLEPQPPGL